MPAAARQARAAGKPGVLTAAQTETLIETAKEHRVVYLEAMRLVFDDALPIIQSALPEIGRSAA